MTANNEQKQLLAVIKKTMTEPAMQEQFAAALPAHVTPEKFTRVSMMAIQNDSYLIGADRQSLYQACVQCATDGLLPDGREAALVTFGKQVQYMPMVQGIMKMVRNSGDLLSIGAHVVRANDEFVYELGDDERIVHRPLLSGDRGDIIFTYAIAKTKDGGIYREVMDEEQIAKVKNISRSGAKDRGPWADWPEEMRKKSAIRRLSKKLPMSTDMNEMLLRGDDSEFPDKDEPPKPAQAAGPTRLKDALGINDGDVTDAELVEPEEEELSPQQKAARTRAANKAAKEAAEAEGESENPAPPGADDSDLAKAEHTL